METKARLATRLPPSYLRNVRHFAGAPKGLIDDKDTQREMPPASILVIERAEDGVLLIRYAADGKFAGDSWHPNICEAQEQAAYEFEVHDSVWIEIPQDVNDVATFMNSSAS